MSASGIDYGLVACAKILFLKSYSIYCGDLTHFSPKTLRFQVFYLKQRQSTNNQLDVHVYYERGLVTSFKYPSQAKVDNEYSKDDIMLKGRVIRKTIHNIHI